MSMFLLTPLSFSYSLFHHFPRAFKYPTTLNLNLKHTSSKFNKYVRGNVSRKSLASFSSTAVSHAFDEFPQQQTYGSSEGIDLLHIMEMRGIRANVQTYLWLLDGCYNSGSLLSAHKQLEEIIGGAEASNDEVEEEAEKIVEIFPQLRKLTLQYLPELKTICSSSNVILCDSLNSITIYDCPKLKRLPLSLHLIDGELSSPPSSLQIKIDKERWELLEWDNHDMKMVLEPICRFWPAVKSQGVLSRFT